MMRRSEWSGALALRLSWSRSSLRVFGTCLVLAALAVVLFSDHAIAQSPADVLSGLGNLGGGSKQTGPQPVEPGNFDQIVNNAKLNSVQWRLAEEPYTRKLFWSLAVIELVITVGLMLLPGAELGGLLALGMGFIIRKGFWAFIMETAGTTLPAITESLQQIGVKATAVTGGITPQAVVNALGLFTISHWKHVGSNPIIWFEVAIGYFLVIIPFGLCALFTWIAYLRMYFVMGGGHIMLAFGGNKWLEDYARRFLSFVFASGVNLLVLELCKGLFFTYLMEWINYANASKELLPFSTLMRLSVYGTAMAITLISVPSYMAGMVSGTVSHFAEGAALAGAPKALAAAATVMATAGKMVAQAAQTLMKAAAAASSSQGGGGMVLAGAGGGGITVSSGGTPPPSGGFGYLPGLGGGPSGGGPSGGGGGGGPGGGGRGGAGGGLALLSPHGVGAGTPPAPPTVSSPARHAGSESAPEVAPPSASNSPSTSPSAGDRSKPSGGAVSGQGSAPAALGTSGSAPLAMPKAPAASQEGARTGAAAPQATRTTPSQGVGAALGDKTGDGVRPEVAPLEAKTMGKGIAPAEPAKPSAGPKKPLTDGKA
jgi:type IV secretion system protein TrbL